MEDLIAVILYKNIADSKIVVDNALYNVIQTRKLRKKKHASIKDINPLIEDYVNALDVACGFAIRNKIDFELFKSLYNNEIINITQSKVYSSILSNKLDYKNLYYYLEKSLEDNIESVT